MYYVTEPLSNGQATDLSLLVDTNLGTGPRWFYSLISQVNTEELGDIKDKELAEQLDISIRTLYGMRRELLEKGWAKQVRREVADGKDKIKSVHVFAIGNSEVNANDILDTYII